MRFRACLGCRVRIGFTAVHGVEGLAFCSAVWIQIDIPTDLRQGVSMNSLVLGYNRDLRWTSARSAAKVGPPHLPFWTSGSIGNQQAAVLCCPIP